MDITGKLDVEFLNYEYDRSLDESVDRQQYMRVDRAWNIYFHGFMDHLCDIAYVKTKTAIEPGIYEVVVYDMPAYLFIWKYGDDHPRDLKGLIVKADNVEMTKHAFEQYTANKYFI